MSRELPTGRLGRVTVALFTLYVRDAERTEAYPDRAKIEREWRGQAQILRDDWLERGRYVLRAVGSAPEEQPSLGGWKPLELDTIEEPPAVSR